MARHRRYPTKKSSKSKIAKLQKDDKKSAAESVVPLPPPPLDKKGRKLNKAPPESMLDDQPVPWKWRQLKQLTDKAKEDQGQRQAKRKKQRSTRNRLLEETLKLGYHSRPWEDPRSLVYRVQRDQNKAINEELLKARFGTAGRDVKEIAQEYKAIDEKAKRRKLQQMARREKMRKLREKERHFAEKRQKRQIGGMEMEVEESGDEEEEEDERMEEEEAKEQEKGDGDSKSESKKLKGQGRRKRLGKTDKIRLKRREQRHQAQKELILNAQEVIPFGERVDAPPMFSGEMGQRIRPLYAQAGKKDLLLKQKLTVSSEVGEKS